jgi:uncharacterized protein (TIGR02246 family)
MPGNRSVALLIIASFAAALITGCSQAPAPPLVDTRKAAEAAINAASDEFAKAGDAKDLDKVMTYYTDDAVLFVPSAPAAVGKDAVRKAWQGFLAGPSSKVEISGTIIDVAASGDLAFERGSFTITSTDAKGKTTSMTGKLVDVWKKQADGSWKMAADTNALDK